MNGNVNLAILPKSKENSMTTGEKIKYYRKQAGLTGKQLSELTGINHGQIRQYETNQTIPRLKNANKIAKALNIDTNMIIPINIAKCYIYDGEVLGAEEVLTRLADEGRITLDWSEEGQVYHIF